MPSWSEHTAYSDPGRHRELLRALPADLTALCATARNVIGHYRAELTDLPPERRGEINSRWLDTILDVDQRRHPRSLDQPRPPAERVAGCCRDHALFVVAVLRERGVPARTRVGFAAYFVPGYHLDHVVAEHWDGERWRRTDPELTRDRVAFDPEDMPCGADTPFQTAAEAWRRYRDGAVDPARYCVFPGSELSGPGFLRSYVVLEIAHRQGDELLLWDGWAAIDHPAADEVLDELAALVVRADSGDGAAEQELAYRYDRDGLRPPEVVTQYSPYGDPPELIRLEEDHGPPVSAEGDGDLVDVGKTRGGGRVE